MPLYEFKCNKCGEVFEDICPTGLKSMLCPICTGPARYKPSRFGVNSISPSSEKQMLKEGFVYREKGMDKDAERNKKYIEENKSKVREQLAGEIIQDLQIGRV